MTLSFTRSPCLLSLRNQTRRLRHWFQSAAQAVPARMSQNGLLPIRLVRQIGTPGNRLSLRLQNKESGT